MLDTKSHASTLANDRYVALGVTVMRIGNRFGCVGCHKDDRRSGLVKKVARRPAKRWYSATCFLTRSEELGADSFKLVSLPVTINLVAGSPSAAHGAT